MLEITYALIAGLLTGVFFTIIKLPLPAPPVFSGIVGILGVYLGSILVNYVKSVL